jgi:glycosyltransferase involved in cell wall biosynthesis
MTEPSVSIAVVLSDALENVERAVRSALDQSFRNLDILLCDGAVSQENAAFCDRMRALDSRVRVVRDNKRLGFVDTCHLGWQQAGGAYFLWLDADTWLTPHYVEQGVAFLERNASHFLVFGTVTRRGEAGDEVLSSPLSVSYEDPARRLELLLTTMAGGEAWYGVLRRQGLETMPLHNGLGYYYGWLLSVAWRGKIAAMPEMILHRDGLLDERDASDEVLRLSVGNFQATDRWLSVAALLFCNIAFFDDAMDGLPFLERVRLAAAAADAIANRRRVLDEGMMVSFASRLFPSAHIVERFRDMRTALADAVMRLPVLSSTDPVAQNLVGTINVLCRMRIGNIPMTKEDRDIVRQLEDMWDRDQKVGTQNKVAIVSAMYL